ncbi:sodium:solute symporter [Pontiella agarivorans]|uniref:Sodium:solute symporter n=1 Tax=Pontiella agarivorans TaxID=3038953 RepID=A0ABU5MU15_9BACT|nr:sodium:solute symporter [Pontiella agarivorans]MDZ8117696.1 sodium:solute symporter [Pontiella agarivorans]
MRIQIAGLDLVILAVYLIGIVALGCLAGVWRKKNSSGDGESYFLAGGSLKWPMIGLALFSTNISTVHLVSLAEEGYKNGLAYGNFEWMAPFTLIILALFFAPFYIRSKVATLPDFLERRYSKGSRNWLSGLSIISAIFIHIGFSLYAGAIVLEGLFGIPLMYSIIGIAVLTGVYTMIGGLMAVVLTESVQTVVLLIGAIVLTGIALVKVGGWSGLTETVDPHMFSVLRPKGDPSGLPWYSILLGYPITGIWYWCTDQTIVQRVLGAKDEQQARLGPLFAGFLKILPVFIFVLPGLIAQALIMQGKLPAIEKSADVYSVMITHLLPVGLKGLIAAALMAALMSTVSGALNSAATLFSYDLYKQWKPETTEKKLISIGRIVTIVGMVLAICVAPFLGRYPTIFQGINAAICYISPPITAVFVFGVFWKKASSFGSFTTLVIGSALGFVVFGLDFYKEQTGWNIPFMMSGFYLFCICAVIMVTASLMKPEELTEEKAALVWNHPLDALRAPGLPGFGNYKMLSAVLFVVMIILYTIFH